MKNKKKKILIVDDEALIAMAQAETIRHFGYEAITVNSGEEAIGFISGDENIDLVLMDIDLGRGIRGPEAAQQILGMRNVPIVFLTSHSEREMVETVRGITRYGYVIKNSGDFVLQSSIEMAFELFEAHQASGESEERFRIHFQNNPIPIFTWQHRNGDFILVDCNRAAHDITEGRTTRFMGMNALDLYTDRPDIINDMNQCFEGHATIHKVIRSEHFIPGRLGSMTMLFVRPDLVMVHLEDITERTQAEEELRESEEAFKTIFEEAEIGIVITSPSFVFEKVNPAFCRMMGYTASELCAMTFADITHPEHISQDIENVKKVGRGEIPFYRTEKRYVGKTGDILWGRLVVSSIRDSEGTLRNFLSLIENITDQRQTEGALEERETRYERLLNSVMDYVYTVYIVDGHPVRTVHGQGCESVTGYSPGDYQSDPNLWYNMVYDEDRTAVVTHAADVIAGRARPYLEHRIRHRNGEIRWVRNTTVSRYDELRRLVSYDSIIMDITDRKLAEDKLLEAIQESNILREKSEQANRDKELLLREVHHRIKNNMSVMTGLLSLQARTLKDPSAVAALRDASDRIKSMEVLYNKLYRSDNFSEMSVRDYLPPLVDEIISIFPNRDSVKIEKKIDDFVLGIKILPPLGLIVNELLTNAMKHAFTGRDDGLITISASTRDNRATVIIEDNGNGIPGSVDIESAGGFGLKLVGLLTKQIGGTLKIERRAGAKFVLDFHV